MKTVRCAIYTRKSSEEGLEQEFNSLHAQREACAAYVASQKHEGWTLLPDLYDDGGISGGTLARPSLQRMLKDVEDGRIDQIVVYKIDRLTRSLSDFSKLVDRLDGAGASFVSVTQSFNTATSMGRLTLNVLLSFAQFEREVTAERIRDKIAASKKKGLWMGGAVPLGYRPEGRTLKIVESEAAIVREVFNLYREHCSLTATTQAAEDQGLRSRPRKSRPDGMIMGRGHIHAILTNPVYAGRIRHKDQIYDGLHEAIIDQAQWDALQDILISEARRVRARPNGSSPISGNQSLLIGKLFDETDDPLSPSHANKKGRRYRYYVSSRLLQRPIDATAGPKQKRADTSRHDGWRLPAPALESQVADAILRHIDDGVIPALLRNLDIRQVEQLRGCIDDLRNDANRTKHLCALVIRAKLKAGTISIDLDPQRLAKSLGTEQSTATTLPTSFDAPFDIRRRGVEARLVIGDRSTASVDQTLIDNLARANEALSMVKVGKSFAAIGETMNLSSQRIRQLLPMALLAPDAIRDILNGSQPAGLTSEWLQRQDLPVAWQEQRNRLAAL